ncbi:hypothetical protein BP6252_13935 [Coleophoma cylindrospora]|uniref:Uncharacterized protein n=1 Tax=Coleophoma cylindrospora TaxID=1849047 RepID=A0A3D8Q5A0_9HELO|nr:hypothetical protein BP6252_13935 [Coleophoma cylindrospora]
MSAFARFEFSDRPIHSRSPSRRQETHQDFKLSLHRAVQPPDLPHLFQQHEEVPHNHQRAGIVDRHQLHQSPRRRDGKTKDIGMVQPRVDGLELRHAARVRLQRVGVHLLEVQILQQEIKRIFAWTRAGRFDITLCQGALLQDHALDLLILDAIQPRSNNGVESLPRPEPVRERSRAGFAVIREKLLAAYRVTGNIRTSSEQYLYIMDGDAFFQLLRVLNNGLRHVPVGSSRDLFIRRVTDPQVEGGKAQNGIHEARRTKSEVNHPVRPDVLATKVVAVEEAVGNIKLGGAHL